MFVAINNTDMNIPQVTEWIMKERNANDGVISPEFAMEVLSKTNHFGHIKMILKNIRNLSDDEKKKYKEFVLACVDGREMSSEALESLGVFADICGVKEEFEELNNKPKLYNKTDADGVTIKSKEDLKLLKGSDLKVYVDGEMFDEVAVVHLSEIDLSKIKALKFRENSKVDLSYATNLPSDLDVSMCSEVDLCFVDLCNVGELSFAEGADVNLLAAKNLPSDLDFSMCSKVNLCGCDLSNVDELSFAEGAKVLLCRAKNLPEKVDFSMCDEVSLMGCDLSNVRELKFKNKRQKNMALKSFEGFNGKISYEGDDAKKNNVWYSKLQDFFGKRRM